MSKNTSVTHRTLNGLTVPLLGLGTMRLPLNSENTEDIDYAKTAEMLELAMQSGVNYIDTAYMYHNGKSEVCLGELLKKYPRSSYFLVDKMPSWFAKSEEDIEKIFNEQLKRCQTEYFDFYLVHAVDHNNWELTKKFHVVEFLEQKKAEGKIRNLGFSFHDTPEFLKTVVARRKWDFAQIQLNYLDWTLYRSREQYEILAENNIPVMVMEPLRGGSLALLNPPANEILKAYNPDASTASWGLRYVASLPNVLCVLSGMSNPEQMQDNLRTFTDFKPLTDEERAVLEKALAAYRKQLAVPCTACRYCMPCPAGVEIPRIFALYNQYTITSHKWVFQNSYNTIPAENQASACVNCGKCAEHCPQKIRIPGMLQKIHNEVNS